MFVNILIFFIISRSTRQIKKTIKCQKGKFKFEQYLVQSMIIHYTGISIIS